MITHNFYTIPTGIDKDQADIIIRQSRNLANEIALVGNEKGENVLKLEKKRSDIRWIPTDNWIAGMMAHFVHSANNEFFNFKLEGWSDRIQYTEYNGKGTHYGWHADIRESTLIKGGARKLSISLILSDPSEYEGGELQLLLADRSKMQTFKPPIGTAIIFPSTALHRVRPLRSGSRVSLVGWMGGPPFV